MYLSIGKISDMILKYSGKIIYSVVILIIGFLFLKVSNRMLEKWKKKQRSSVFPINQKRIEAQPLNMPTSGSTFKNPKDHFAGKLLETVGLKGYRIKDIGFSERHANFLINYKNASFQNVIDILNIAKEQVYKAFNIILEEEIKLICA